MLQTAPKGAVCSNVDLDLATVYVKTCKNHPPFLSGLESLLNYLVSSGSKLFANDFIMEISSNM